MSTPSDNYPTLTEVVIPATVTHEGNTYHVTAIGEEAFMFCGNLKSVHMPDSIREIKNYAFSACTSLKKVVMGKYTETIGANAFNTCLAMTEVVLPLSLSKVEVAAFDNCDNITDIYSLAQDVPILGDLAFRSCYGATVHVPCDMEYFYATDEEWSKFDTIVCIAADSAEASAVIVAPTTNSVSITWPAQENAHSYTLEIAKNDTVHCSLFFNEDGKVSHVSYAPARNGHAPARYNVESEDAFQITILGLAPNTLYAYTINSRSEIEGEDTLIDEGTFLTLGGTSTDLENTMLNNHNGKFILNGAIVIRHNGKTYSIMGQELK
jgi:hypothetical protein